MSILIVEDQSAVADILEGMVIEMGFEDCRKVSNFQEALDALNTDSPDLVLLDIRLENGREGFEIAKIINALHQIPFIFITSHSDEQTISEAIETDPFGFLIKPVRSEELLASLLLASRLSPSSSKSFSGDKDSELIIDDSLFVRSRKMFFRVKLSSILYIKALSNYVELITDKKRYVIRMSLNKFLERLDQEQFLKVHRSYVVNIKHIEAINRTSIIIGDTRIPLGKINREELLNALNLI